MNLLSLVAAFYRVFSIACAAMNGLGSLFAISDIFSIACAAMNVRPLPWPETGPFSIACAAMNLGMPGYPRETNFSIACAAMNPQFRIVKERGIKALTQHCPINDQFGMAPITPGLFMIFSGSSETKVMT